MPSGNTGRVILKIKKNKKDVVITLTDRTKLRLQLEVLATFYLYEGKILSKKEFKELEDFSASAALMKYALSLLKKGHYSEWKIREKLFAKDGKKSDVDKVIKKLKEYNLINDQMLALDLVEYGNERNLGKNKIIQELSNKGIFKEKITKINFPTSLEKKKAMSHLPKLEKKYDKYSYEQKKQHIYRALISLGFDGDVALDTMNKISAPKVKEEENKLDKDFEKTYVRLSLKYEGYELKSKVIAALKGKGYKTSDILRRMDKKYGENDF